MGEGAKYEKIFAQGRIKWKKSCPPNYPKKYWCAWKESYKENDNEKKLMQLQSSPTPITFLIVRVPNVRT